MRDIPVEVQALIVLTTQIIFLYLRTINIRATASGKMWLSIWTGNGIAITWLVGISIGAHAMLEGNVLPLVAHLLGGSIGTYLALRKQKNKDCKDE